MRSLTTRITTAIFALLFTASLSAQANKTDDRLQVRFDRPVKVSETLTLQPGAYVFRQLSSDAELNLFHIFRASDMKAMGNTAMASPARSGGMSPTPRAIPEYTSVELVRAGGQDYLDTIWFAGQNKGYSFDLGQEQAIKDAIAAGKGDREPAQVVRILLPAIIGIEVKDERASKSESSTTSTHKAANQDAGDWSTADRTSGATTTDSRATQNTSDVSGQNTQNASDTSGQNTGNMTAADRTRDTLPQSDEGDTSSGPQERRVVGCLTGPYGGSYMVTTSNGDKYELRGDFDNVREFINRTVTVWAVPGQAASSDSQANPKTGTSKSSTGQQAPQQQSSSGHLGAPEVISFSRIMLESEQCDRSMMK